MRSRPTPTVCTGTLYLRISAAISRPNRPLLSAPSLITSRAPSGTAVDSRSTLRTDSPTPLLAPGGGKASGCSDRIRSGLPENPYRRTRNFSSKAGKARSCRAVAARANRDRPSSTSAMLLDVSTSTATAFWRLLSDWIPSAGCHNSTSARATVATCRTQTHHKAAPVSRLGTRRAYTSKATAASAVSATSNHGDQPVANRNSPFR